MSKINSPLEKAIVEPRGKELIERYKKNYNISEASELTGDMILAHWELEKRLTRELLKSDTQNRWEVFERCYSTLYKELEWLNRLIDSNSKTLSPPAQRYKNWTCLIGQPPLKIYEIGSGKGEMITYLADCGFECKATEITRERGKKHVANHPNLSWGISDGVHFEKFEPLGFYDIIVSNQVIEHLHPEDLYNHFKGTASILSNEGRYIFSTPHMLTGPHDISRVFKLEKPVGMHLKEYTYRELKEILLASGFKKVYSVLRLPRLQPKISSFYLDYLCWIEKLLESLPRQTIQKIEFFFRMFLFFNANIFIIAQK